MITRRGTVTSFAPGQVTHVTMKPEMMPQCLGLLFHPGTHQGHAFWLREMRDCSFFSLIAPNEALHPSRRGEADIQGLLGENQDRVATPDR